MSKEIKLRLTALHPAQLKVTQLAKRFNVVCCARRWGKTVLGMDRLIHRALHQELLVVTDTLVRIPIGNPATLYLQKTPELAHQGPASPTASSGRERVSAPFAAARAASSSCSSRSRITRL